MPRFCGAFCAQAGRMGMRYSLTPPASRPALLRDRATQNRLVQRPFDARSNDLRHDIDARGHLTFVVISGRIGRPVSGRIVQL